MKLAAVLALAAACALPGAAQNSIPLFHPGALRVLVLSGRNNHDWRATTPAIRKLLLSSGKFDVRVNEEPAGMSAVTLAAYDAVVLDYNGPRWGEQSEKALEGFVRGGKGLLVLHGASWAFSGLEVLGDNHVKTGILEPAWPEYARMTGGVWSVEAPKTGHGKRHVFEVKIVDREHPVCAGLPGTLQADDELYHGMKMQPDAHILATAFDDPSTGGTGRDEPILWTVAYGRGRVFHTTLGHDPAAMAQPAFTLPFVRAAEWISERR
jgi:type 1 glutamine amidotransferase